MTSLRTMRSGFTLIEVVVVTSIIAILAGAALMSFNDARTQARDDIRMSQLEQLRLALELYKSEYGQYPAAGCTAGTSWVGPGTFDPDPDFSWGASCDEYIVGLVPDFLPRLPLDPLRSLEDSSHVIGIMYRTNPERTMYKVIFRNTVEVQKVQSYNDPFARCPRQFVSGQPACQPADIKQGIGVEQYAVYSPGAEAW